MLTRNHGNFLRSACIIAMLAAFASVPVGHAQEKSQEQSQDDTQQEPGIFALETEAGSPAFDTAAAAIDAFKSALASDDFAGLANLLGLDSDKLGKDDNARNTFEQMREAAGQQLVVQELEDRQILQLGQKLWPMPFPLVKGDDGKWAFDTEAGLEEVINRRVGENELEAIATMRAYVDAQKEYASADHSGDGVLEYAQKLISSEGKTDGLYWPPDQGDGESPAGAFADQSELQDASKGEGYFGYHFRILTGQGDRIAGGAYDYVINGHMIGGFGLLAWPAKYGETGVRTFAVNQQGIVYEVDLGDETDTIVKYIDRFNPDDSWDIVND